MEEFSTKINYTGPQTRAVCVSSRLEYWGTRDMLDDTASPIQTYDNIALVGYATRPSGRKIVKFEFEGMFQTSSETVVPGINDEVVTTDSTMRLVLGKDMRACDRSTNRHVNVLPRFWDTSEPIPEEDPDPLLSIDNVLKPLLKVKYYEGATTSSSCTDTNAVWVPLSSDNWFLNRLPIIAEGTVERRDGNCYLLPGAFMYDHGIDPGKREKLVRSIADTMHGNVADCIIGRVAYYTWQDFLSYFRQTIYSVKEWLMKQDYTGEEQVYVVLWSLTPEKSNLTMLAVAWELCGLADLCALLMHKYRNNFRLHPKIVMTSKSTSAGNDARKSIRWYIPKQCRLVTVFVDDGV